MEKHLNRKNVCPSGKTNLDITDDIKQIILRDRFYHPPTPTPKTSRSVQNIVTNNNSVMNFINTSLTPLQMVESYTQYHNINVRPVDEYLEEKFSDANESLENPMFSFELQVDDLLTVIDEISSSSKRHDDMNILYDSKEDKISIKEDDEWKSSIVNRGLKQILEKLQEFYLDYYECFVITKIITSSNAFVQQQNKELVDVYYRFIAAFDLPPYVKDQRDYYIVKSITNRKETKIADEFMDRYRQVRESLKVCDKRSIRKDVLDIIKKNSTTNMNTLKSRISDMFCDDQTFKEYMENIIKENRKEWLLPFDKQPPSTNVA
jgi:hypothetical protein